MYDLTWFCKDPPAFVGADGGDRRCRSREPRPGLSLESRWWGLGLGWGLLS